MEQVAAAIAATRIYLCIKNAESVTIHNEYTAEYTA
jgi:hypothetical protein